MQVRDPSVGATARLHSQGHAHVYSVANSTLLTHNNNAFLSSQTKPPQTPPTPSPAPHYYPSGIATAQSFPLSCLLELLAIEFVRKSAHWK